MAVANGEHARRIAPSWIIGTERLTLRGVMTLFAHSGRLESTLSGHCGPRPWTPQLGGKRAHRGRLEKNRSARESRRSITGLPETATGRRPAPDGPGAFAPYPVSLERAKLQRTLLAAQGNLAQPAPSHAGRQCGKAIEERGRGENAIFSFAAGLDDAGGGVNRIADQRDLLLQIAELADSDRAAVKAGAKVGDEAEVALVSRPLRVNSVERAEAGTARSRPGSRPERAAR